MKTIHILLAFSILSSFSFFSQVGTLKGSISVDGEKHLYSTVILNDGTYKTKTDEQGNFLFNKLPFGNYKIQVQSFTGESLSDSITINQTEVFHHFQFKSTLDIQEVVVSGSLKEISKLDCTVPVEIYSPAFFKKNPSPNIYDALQNVNGVRPQLNCNVCNTGDIHINGLEGPYTMVLIDGMPIVSSLSSVYGLSGIPTSLIERVEIVRGPASALYGSEAIGGIINIITKDSGKAAKLYVDVSSNSWLESNVDIGFKSNIGKKAKLLTGINYFNFSLPIDNNGDNFTDITLQDRISIFQKWNFDRKDKKLFALAGRYLYEDRWGGEMQWNRSFRGGDSIYGESIYTNRWELLGSYELPIKEKVMLSFSANQHLQDSRYGTTSFIAEQQVFFGQAVYYKTVSRHDFLIGTATRYTYYDDNTFGTLDEDSLSNLPSRVLLPGFFIQDDIALNEKTKLLLGGRYDHSSSHGSIFTPRIGMKYNFSEKQLLRLNAGTGYRVVNVFTEDHAALTGARKTEVAEELHPETSYNVNMNYYHIMRLPKQSNMTIDATLFYTYFNQKIIPDYLTDPNKIIYTNIPGFAESKGFSLNLSGRLPFQLKYSLGGTIMDNTWTEDGVTRRQLLSEQFTGTWSLSYCIPRIQMCIDYTGNLYGPMLLPTLGPDDPRSPISPWWSIQNIQLVYNGIRNFEFYGGVKNLLNWTPARSEPFIIARAEDPFDKQVVFNTDGTVVPTTDNPNALTFDAAYVYGPNQGIRGYFGVRYTLK